MQIMPETLKRLRSRVPMSQDDLAEASGVSKKTIARIETGKSVPNSITVQRLATALKVTPEDLGRRPEETSDSDRRFEEVGLRPLKTYVDGETALAFQMVEDVYGISIASQVEMAPLFSALLAEGSLDWRRKQLAQIDEAADRLMSLGGGHLSFVNAAYRVQDGSMEEGLSITMRDLFGKKVGEDTFDLGFNPSKNNPFADYLKAFAKKVEAKQVLFDPNETDRLNDAGFPDYRIAPVRIDELTGNDSVAEFALLRGYAMVSAIPSDLLDNKNTAKRIEWLVSQVPAVERDRLRARQEEFSRIFDTVTASIVSKGGDENAS